MFEDIYFLDYFINYLDLNDLSKFCRLCKRTYFVVQNNEYFSKISVDIKNGLSVSKVFSKGNVHICKLLYSKYSKLVNSEDIIMMGGQMNVTQYISTDRYDIIFNMTNAFRNFCLNDDCEGTKWFTSNYGICLSNNKYMLINKMTDDDINEIFVIVCENNKNNMVKWLFTNYDVSDLAIMNAFTFCLKLEYFNICKFLFDNCNIIRFLINFNFENLIGIYKNENKENIIKWLRKVNV
ncbi:hypothetical protein Catovirus_1_677 [Catovirus CTV1]|uniref:F-box domain-containing protein n=1 Tax=Catovirus CTV1 TaxID=1977631 RepID=A0A1V0SA82_9VIRU|nr:hypothetical protein Catovirus_1_677 [Catovirus CTV1]